MELPPQEQFTLEEVANRLSTPLRKVEAHYVEKQVCTRNFKYIIVEGPVVIHRVYFDRDLWIKDYGEKVALDPASQKKEYEEIVKSQQAYLEREYGARWQKEHGGKIKFDPTTLKRQYENLHKTFYLIGPNESAYLWKPSQPSEPWKRPTRAVVYIPRVALEAFELEHGTHPDSVPAQKAKKNERRAALDPSRIGAHEWYGSAQAADILGYNQHYFQNSEILRGKLCAKKIEGSWRYHGQKLIDHLQKNTPKP